MASTTSTFASGGGKVTTDFGGNDYSWGIVVQTDGKILVSGMTNQDFALARYNADGSLDSTFSVDGKVTTDFGGNDFGGGVTMQSDGKILMVGESNGNFALARFNTDGSLDTSFDNDGKVTTNLGGVGMAGASSVVIQSDGRILVVGSVSDSQGHGDFALVRYNANGSLDNSFGSGGKVITDIGHEDYAADVKVLSDGKILVAGVTWLGN